ncbi:hypothetical protein PTTG_26472 [Puccinia triticina 1-1 BBBD Race 1]|uniref:Uncharacterized protein n=2 Tax=Puccinia triticina TaxID=208348 RepID=A0A180GV21_PUCT1|nr:hypothetical protein PTTG_26472 [Puccinia triticina 1-1 BBBD Race 1]
MNMVRQNQAEILSTDPFPIRFCEDEVKNILLCVRAVNLKKGDKVNIDKGMIAMKAPVIPHREHLRKYRYCNLDVPITIGQPTAAYCCPNIDLFAIDQELLTRAVYKADLKAHCKQHRIAV